MAVILWLIKRSFLELVKQFEASRWPVVQEALCSSSRAGRLRADTSCGFAGFEAISANAVGSYARAAAATAPLFNLIINSVMERLDGRACYLHHAANRRTIPKQQSSLSVRGRMNDCLGLEKLAEGEFAPLPTIAGHLVSAERSFDILRRAIYVDHAGFKSVSYSLGLFPAC